MDDKLKASRELANIFNAERSIKAGHYHALARDAQLA
jgi:hypothetical protein